jgi:hypothetical protein
VLFAERANESDHSARLSPFGVETQGNRVLKARRVFIRTLSVRDPKPSELAMVRMNPDESQGEVRTDKPCNTFR